MQRQHCAGASERDLQSARRIFPSIELQSRPRFWPVKAKAVFNGFLQSAIAGIRGASPEPVRQFILRDEEFDIHIKISGHEDCRCIHGQLLPRDGKEFPPPARCHLLRNGVRIQSTGTDETGEFQFDEVPEGGLYLQVDLTGLTIVGSLNTQD